MSKNTKLTIYVWATTSIIFLSFILCFIIWNSPGTFILFNFITILSVIIFDEKLYPELYDEIAWIRFDKNYPNCNIKQIKEEILKSDNNWKYNKKRPYLFLGIIYSISSISVTKIGNMYLLSFSSYINSLCFCG